MAAKNEGAASKVQPDAGKKLPPNAGKGRKKGVPNKATKRAREAIARFVDGNCDRLQAWLDEIHEQDGAQAAFKCFADLLEYHVPKLSRSEHTGADGKDLMPTRIEIVAGGDEGKD